MQTTESSSNNKIILIEGYQVIEELQLGGQANIYKVKKQQEIFVMKVYKNDQNSKNCFQKQVHFLMNIFHKGIVKIIDSFDHATITYENGSINFSYCILLEYLTNKDLHQILQDGPLNQQAAKCVFKQILSIILYLDSEKVYHRDIKPANIMFNENYEVVLIDFGMSSAKQHHQSQISGTIQFLAPQIFKKKQSNLKSELFCLGVNLFVMCFGFYPFQQAKSTDPIYRIIMEKNYNKFWAKHQLAPNPKLKSLIQGLLCWNTNQRIQVEAILGHEWIADGQQYTQDQLSKYLSERSRYKKDREIDQGEMNFFEMPYQKIEKQINYSLTQNT